MNNTEDSNTQNFQSLIENYETVIKEITTELTTFQIEHGDLREKFVSLLAENEHLRTELDSALAEKSKEDEVQHQFNRGDFVDNLQQQLATVTSEKNSAIELWQNATQTVDNLEDELRIYQDNTQGLVPKTELSKLKNNYEAKVRSLEEALGKSLKKLEETVNLTSNELKIREKEIGDSLQSQGNTLKIVKNLEDEVLKLQKRLSETDSVKRVLEKSNKAKIETIEVLTAKNKECRLKVEEAVQIVEAAFNEKDAALLRENHAKEEFLQLSKTLSDVFATTEEKIKTEVTAARRDYDEKLRSVLEELRSAQEELKLKSVEVDKFSKEVTILNNEIEKLRRGHLNVDESGASKLLILEKNLENTFQKLLLSEKQNIQLSSDKEAIRNDLEQMSRFYERDVKTREAEKIMLKGEIKKLQVDLNEAQNKSYKNEETVADLKRKIELIERTFREEQEETKNSLQTMYLEKIGEVEALHDQLVGELKDQLTSQVLINKKWRTETKSITEKLEKRLHDLKIELRKGKTENKVLREKLKDSNNKIFEYKKFLQLISQDVNKITSIALPDKTETAS